MNSWSVGLLNLDSAFIGEGSLAHFEFSCSLWVLGLLYFLFMSWTCTQTTLEAKSYIWWTQFSGGNLPIFFWWADCIKGKVLDKLIMEHNRQHKAFEYENEWLDTGAQYWILGA
jgi:hypothetical protein